VLYRHSPAVMAVKHGMLCLNIDGITVSVHIDAVTLSSHGDPSPRDALASGGFSQAQRADGLR
jgi:hypothetical protein